MQRLGGLQPLALPGGDVAARQPWRMAAAALHALGRGGEIPQRFADPASQTVAAMLKRSANVPHTSSCGRLFDAAAALLGVKNTNAFEGQAAMLLEGLAASHGSVPPLADGFILQGEALSFLPLLDHLADMRDAAAGAALFHATLAAGLTVWVAQAARRQGLRKVALGGGCFLNTLLSEALEQQLCEQNLVVLRAVQAPCNDGGLALGQAWVGINFMKD
jgi:hydrogenase maturation protein HypF